MGQRVLVTGGTGFVGRRLCAALRKRSIEVWAPNRTELDVASEQIPDGPLDKVFHLAGRSFVPDSWREPAEFFRINVQGTVNVLDFCRRNGTPLVYVSGYCYGIPERLPIPENAPLRPNNPYAFTKAAAEAACGFYSKNLAVRATIVRPFNVYGPGQDNKFLIPQLVDEVLDPSIPELVVRDLRPRRDFIHVDDLVTALCMLPIRDELSVYNVGSGASASVEQIVELVQRAAGTNKPVAVRGKSRPGEIPETVADVTAILALGWRGRIGLREGLQALIVERQRGSSNPGQQAP